MRWMLPAGPLVAVLLIPSLCLAQESKTAATPPAPMMLTVTPAEFTLGCADDVQRLLVTGKSADGRTIDYSRKAIYASSDTKVAEVTPEGVVQPRGNGSAEVRVTFAGRETVARLTVKNFDVEPSVSFRNQVVPIFTKLGCNSGGCHGKASGQNGFKLSLLGFEPEFDYTALVKEARGRRIFPSAPASSLLLLKGAGEAPHGGGKRLTRGTREYELLLRWIKQGTPAGSAKDAAVTRIEVYPHSAVVGRQSEQQVLVTAFYSDGSQRDVTREAQFKSNEPSIAVVDTDGLVHTDKAPGETGIMARYMGQVSVCHISIPMNDGLAPVLGDVAKHNYIDDLVQAKWQKLKIVPSPLADDATFLRRAYLDLIGTLPTPAEVRDFLADNDAAKREKAIDRLLARNEYADFWAVKWGDLLRNQRKGQKENQRGTFAFHAWIRNAFATNMPYDEFVRNIVAAQGTVDQHPPVIWYRTVRNATHQTNDTAQLFLGMRINCAQCHHHPYEKWSQDDYYAFQGFFSRMGKKSGDTSQEPAIFVQPGVASGRNPATGKSLPPRGLDGPAVTISEDEDPRQKLVDWMAAPENPFFARAISNRLWAHFMGRGLVEPVDDMRVTNPPSNPELLDAMAKDLIAHKFNLKHLIRTIMVSTTYQLSSDPLPENIHDQQNYARAYPRRMSAEVMLDAIAHATAVPENFPGLPKGIRAIQLPDESVPSYFLDVFSRPTRETACECERPREANLAQALHLLNSTDIQSRLSNPTGRLAALLKAKKDDAAIIEELYLTTFGRKPRPAELKVAQEHMAAQPDRQAGLEDLFWALLNSKEFLFNH